MCEAASTGGVPCKVGYYCPQVNNMWDRTYCIVFILYYIGLSFRPRLWFFLLALINRAFNYLVAGIIFKK